ncbi:substrate-binding periplasmic protein [Nitrospirillum sp. BR 11828]|uniref:substrate-binding periplasmic protein n=1 Tax=Nitrospirillum sp. BR 11828 TaxID=3104325 RepID=UPI002ACA0E41|nr:transporter substrate-binding domain-containing protein [Nitrospirillum sp. BR 11828]MDZ5650566.1 transporter substrate-binding domain-containing protein [Nitrospirillum sp. BR 11828]
MGATASLIGSLFLSVIASGTALPEATDQSSGKPVIQFLYPDVGPFLQGVSDGEAVKGPIAHRVEALAAAAGYEISWLGPIPRNRILADLQDGRVACTPNVIKTPDREARFKFTAPIFPQIDWVVITKKDANWIKAYPTVEALLRDKTRVYGSMLGASKGPVIDAMTASEATHVRPIRGTPSDLVKMITSGHIDYTIVSGSEDARTAAVAAGIDPSEIVSIHFPELSAVGAGHIMCAPTVSDEVIAAFDKALATMP